MMQQTMNAKERERDEKAEHSRSSSPQAKSEANGAKSSGSDFAAQFDKALKDAFAKAGLSDADKELALRNLERALILNFCGRAYDLLSADAQRQLEEKDIKTLDEAIKFLASALPQNKLREVFAAAVGEVMGDFIEKAGM